MTCPQKWNLTNYPLLPKEYFPAAGSSKAIHQLDQWKWNEYQVIQTIYSKMAEKKNQTIHNHKKGTEQCTLAGHSLFCPLSPFFVFMDLRLTIASKQLLLKTIVLEKSKEKQFHSLLHIFVPTKNLKLCQTTVTVNQSIRNNQPILMTEWHLYTLYVSRWFHGWLISWPLWPNTLLSKRPCWRADRMVVLRHQAQGKTFSAVPKLIHFKITQFIVRSVSGLGKHDILKVTDK